MNKTNRILFLLILFINSNFLGQDRSVNWIQNLGGSNNEEATSIFPTSDGGLIISGFSYSNDGLVVSNQGWQDGWLIKTNENGFIEWQQNFGSNGADVIEEVKEVKDGYIICGWSSSTDQKFINSNGLEDGFIAKIKKDGTLAWIQSFGGSLMDKLFDVQILNNGDIVAVGYLMSPEVNLTNTEHKGLLDIWVIKLRADGQLIWQNAYGGSDDDFAYNINQTPDNKLIIAGNSESLDGQVGVTKGEWDCWILQIDQDGEIDWTSNYGFGGNEVINDLIVADDSYIIVGSSNSIDRTNAHGKYDAWVLEVDMNGQYLNDYSYGSSDNDVINSATYSEKGIYISGKSGTGIASDGWIMQIDNEGEVIFSQIIGGSMSDQFNDIVYVNDALYIAGSSFSSDGDMIQNFGESDVLVAKLGGENSSEITDIKLFPNPVTDHLTVVLENIGIENVSIYNMTGQVMTTFKANNFFQEQINVGDLPAGIYTIQIESQEEMISTQFVKL